MARVFVSTGNKRSNEYERKDAKPLPWARDGVSQVPGKNVPHSGQQQVLYHKLAWQILETCQLSGAGRPWVGAEKAQWLCSTSSHLHGIRCDPLHPTAV